MKVMNIFPLHKPSHLLGGLLLGVLAVTTILPEAQGQDTFTATLTRKNAAHEPKSWFNLDVITYSGTNRIIPNTVDALCFDEGGDVPLAETAPTPDVPSEVHSYQFADLESAFKADAGIGATKGVALVHWLYDNYYNSYFTTFEANGATAFQDILWELELDYNGDLSSVDIGGGAFISTSVNSFHSVILDNLTAWVNDPTYDESYRSNQFGLAYVIDTSTSFPSDQSLLVSWVIPEPTTGLLLGAVGTLALRRRRK